MIYLNDTNYPKGTNKFYVIGADPIYYGKVKEFYKRIGRVGYQSDLSSSNCYTFVACDSEKPGCIVGAGQLFLIEDTVKQRRWGLIENIYVLPSWRRQGIATSIIKSLLAQALGSDCQFCKLTSSKDKVEAHGLYKKLGFVDYGVSFKKFRPKGI